METFGAILLNIFIYILCAIYIMFALWGRYLHECSFLYAQKDTHRIYLRPDINNEHLRVFEDQSTETMDYANSCGVKYINRRISREKK